jgi:hypothetical protein
LKITESTGIEILLSKKTDTLLYDLGLPPRDPGLLQKVSTQKITNNSEV